MTTFADGQDPTDQVRRAQESGVVGYTADSDDALGDLEIYDALIDPNGQGGARNEKQAGQNGMMPPMAAGGARGGAGEQNGNASGQNNGNQNNANGAPNSRSGGAGLGGGGVQAAGMPVAGGFGAPGVSAAGVPAGGATGAGGLGTAPSGAGMSSMTGGTMAASGDENPGMTAPGLHSPNLSGPSAHTPGIDTPGIDSPNVERPGMDGLNQNGIDGPDSPSDNGGIDQPGQDSLTDKASDWIKDKADRAIHDTIDQARRDHESGARGQGSNGQGGDTGGLDDKNLSVDPDAVQGAGRAWGQIAEDMQAIARTAQELHAAPGTTFGFVHQPQPGYSSLRNDIQNWGSGAASEFEKIGRDLGRDAQGYRDLASEQVTTAKESQNV